MNEEYELLIVKGNLENFIPGNMEVLIHGLGYETLNDEEQGEFIENLSNIMSLLRVGAIREMTDGRNKQN